MCAHCDHQELATAAVTPAKEERLAIRIAPETKDLLLARSKGARYSTTRGTGPPGRKSALTGRRTRLPATDSGIYLRASCSRSQMPLKPRKACCPGRGRLHCIFFKMTRVLGRLVPA
jgi:hypothetical protein